MSVIITDVSIFYKANARKQGYYRTWLSHGMWYWEALGNEGCETTQEAAAEAAKRWIRGDK